MATVLSEFLRLSPGSQAVVIALVGSMTWVAARLAFKVLGLVWALVGRLLPQRSTKAAEPAPRCASESTDGPDHL